MFPTINRNMTVQNRETSEKVPIPYHKTTGCAIWYKLFALSHDYIYQSARIPNLQHIFVHAMLFTVDKT